MKTFNHASYPRTYLLSAPIFIFIYLNIAMLAGKFYIVPEDIIFQVFPAWKIDSLEFIDGKLSYRHAILLSKYFIYYSLTGCSVLLALVTLFFDARRTCHYYFQEYVSVKKKLKIIAAMASLMMFCTIYLTYFMRFWGDGIMQGPYIHKAELSLVGLLCIMGWCVYFWASQLVLFLDKYITFNMKRNK